MGGDALYAAFEQIVTTMPWYRQLLDEAGVRRSDVRSSADVVARCPVLTKANTFQRFPIAALAATTPIADLAAVLTSSGHGGQFSFGLSTRADRRAGAAAIDDALDAAFQVRRRPTLAVNCLPMGVTFGSECMTVATTSVREDMAVALVEAFGPAFAQLLLVADPLFLKRLLDHAEARGVDWGRLCTQVVVGEEVFGEHFRAYVSARLGLRHDDMDAPWLMSSMGVGELGLHLLYETRATVTVRQRLATCPGFQRAFARRLGEPAFPLREESNQPRQRGVPMCFAFDPRRIHPEVIEEEGDGFGALLVSMLDPMLPVPLLRYRTGDVARLVSRDEMQAAAWQAGCTLPDDLPMTMVMVRGRARDVLPDGRDVAFYKDAVYADAAVAAGLTGAVRVEVRGAETIVHVQRILGTDDGLCRAARLGEVMRGPLGVPTVCVWPYHAFPFGMTLDYERKFVGYASARSCDGNVQNSAFGFATSTATSRIPTPG